MEAMQIDECLRTLMLGPGATSEEVRRAYLDMVRVWHPDRFQFDLRLRRLAEERLRAINEAYRVLRGIGTEQTAAPQETTNTSGGEPHSTPDPPVFRRPPRARFPARFPFRPPRSLRSKVAYGSAAAALCLAPLAAASWWARMCHVALPLPEVATGQIDNIIPSFPDLMPSNIRETPRQSAAFPDAPPLHSHPTRRGQLEADVIDLKVLKSGAELIPGDDRTGAGELHLVNRTRFDMVAGLLRGKELLREMYVAPGSAASMAHIRLGVYRVLLEAGSELDSKTLRFHHAALPPQLSGPLEFLEISSGSSTSGQFYELILRPDDNR